MEAHLQLFDLLVSHPSGFLALAAGTQVAGE
jgi:hypothetical protein